MLTLRAHPIVLGLLGKEEASSRAHSTRPRAAGETSLCHECVGALQAPQTHKGHFSVGVCDGELFCRCRGLNCLGISLPGFLMGKG